MRPTDENQHGSTRPNLISGIHRHAADDDNILARLERDTVRNIAGNRGRAALQVAAATIVVLVLVFIGWMAYENATAPQVVPMTAAPRDAGSSFSAPDAVADRQIPPTPPAPRETAQAVPSSTGSTLQASSPHALEAQGSGKASQPSSLPGHGGTVSALPPLVMLKTPDAARKITSVAHAGAQDHVPAAISSATPAPRTMSRPLPTAHVRKPAADHVTDAPEVDNDVALLSAIIIHDSAHAAEKAQMEAIASCARFAEGRCAGSKTSRR